MDDLTDLVAETTGSATPDSIAKVCTIPLLEVVMDWNFGGSGVAMIDYHGMN